MIPALDFPLFRPATAGIGHRRNFFKIGCVPLDFKFFLQAIPRDPAGAAADRIPMPAFSR